MHRRDFFKAFAALPLVAVGAVTSRQSGGKLMAQQPAVCPECNGTGFKSEAVRPHVGASYCEMGGGRLYCSSGFQMFRTMPCPRGCLPLLKLSAEEMGWQTGTSRTYWTSEDDPLPRFRMP